MVSVEVRPYQFGWFFVIVKLVWSLSHTYYYQISRRQTTSCDADANCNSFCRTSLGWRVGLDAFRWVVKCEWMSIIGWWQDDCCWGDQCLHKQVHIGILFWITHPARYSWVHYPKEYICTRSAESEMWMQISIYFELLRRRKRTSLYLVLHSI